MTVSGVGAVIALAYTTTIEDPARFKRSSSVAAYLGLTPRALSSDEIPSPVRAVGDEPTVAPLQQVGPGHFVAAHRVGGAY